MTSVKLDRHLDGDALTYKKGFEGLGNDAILPIMRLLWRKQI